MDDTAIIGAIRLKGYPSAPSLDDTEITEAVQEILRQLKPKYPVETYGLFTAVAGQQVYDLYNAVLDAATQQGVFPGGLRTIEIVWSPSGLSSNDSVFGIAPFLQGMTLMPGGLSVYTFATPTDWWIWDANWSSFVNRFGSQPFEHVNNLPGAPVRIFPVPGGGEPVFVRFTRARTEAELRADDDSWFLTLVQSECAYTIHRKLNAVAGTKIGTLSQDGKSALYWKTEGDRLAMKGWKEFETRQYTTGSAVMRS
jgi:hypothetical protein